MLPLKLLAAQTHSPGGLWFAAAVRDFEEAVQRRHEAEQARQDLQAKIDAARKKVQVCIGIPADMPALSLQHFQQYCLATPSLHLPTLSTLFTKMQGKSECRHSKQVKAGPDVPLDYACTEYSRPVQPCCRDDLHKISNALQRSHVI